MRANVFVYHSYGDVRQANVVSNQETFNLLLLLFLAVVVDFLFCLSSHMDAMASINVVAAIHTQAQVLRFDEGEIWSHYCMKKSIEHCQTDGFEYG